MKNNDDEKLKSKRIELNLPFSVSESDIFRAYSNALNSSYKTPYAKAIGSTLLDEVYDLRKDELKAFLVDAVNLTLVSDGVGYSTF